MSRHNFNRYVIIIDGDFKCVYYNKNAENIFAGDDILPPAFVTLEDDVYTVIAPKYLNEYVNGLIEAEIFDSEPFYKIEVKNATSACMTLEFKDGKFELVQEGNMKIVQNYFNNLQTYPEILDKFQLINDLLYICAGEYDMSSQGHSLLIRVMLWSSIKNIKDELYLLLCRTDLNRYQIVKLMLGLAYTDIIDRTLQFNTQELMYSEKFEKFYLDNIYILNHFKKTDIELRLNELTPDYLLNLYFFPNEENLDEASSYYFKILDRIVFIKKEAIMQHCKLVQKTLDNISEKIIMLHETDFELYNRLKVWLNAVIIDFDTSLFDMDKAAIFKDGDEYISLCRFKWLFNQYDEEEFDFYREYNEWNHKDDKEYEEYTYKLSTFFWLLPQTIRMLEMVDKKWAAFCEWLHANPELHIFGVDLHKNSQMLMWFITNLYKKEELI